MKTTASRNGFTLVELMIVVVIIGVLASIAIPNFIAMQRRAKEGGVKTNMHTVQIAVEDFSVLNDSAYPTGAGSTVPDGRTLQQLCPAGVFPANPFTNAQSVMVFNTNPTTGNPGELAMNPALANGYWLKGNGSNGDTLGLILTTGQ